MKRILLTTTIASLAFATVVLAQGYVFNTNLTVGSTGPDVSALQTWLVTNGYSIPAISSGAAAKGYFGSQTKAAVQQYQAAKGIPSTGFVGPLTRASLNGGAAVMTAPATCPVGFTCTPVGGTTVPVVGTTGGISTPGVVGTLAVSLWSTPSGIVAYKGQSYDVAAYKVQASASDMAIQNLTFDFDVRLWLYASAITIKDDLGNVVGQLTSLNQGNFSELTVGSDYRVSVPVNNYVVRATQSRYLTVNISFLPTSDRASGTINVLNTQIRSVDGTGVTDTETNNSGVATPRSFSYQGSGAGSIIVTIDSASPNTGLVQLSTSVQTQNVVLGIFDIKSQNAPSTLRSMEVGLHTVGAGNVSTLFSNLQIKVGGLTYSANNICTDNTSSGCVGTLSTVSSSTVIFNNMTVPLAADQYVPITVSANIAVDTNGALDGTIASTTFAVVGSTGGTDNNPDVEDQSFNTLAVNSAVFTANNLTFTGSSVTESGLSTHQNSANVTTSGTATEQFSFNFSLAAGNNPIYVSAVQGTAITAVNSNPGGMTVTALNFSDNGNTSGDSSGVYFYIAPGQTKSFTATYSATGALSGGGTYGVTSLNYSTTTSPLTGGSLNSADILSTLKAILY